MPGEASVLTDVCHGLSQVEYIQLTTYNGERGRGIMHTMEWKAQMAELQRRYDTYEVRRAL